MEKEDEKLNKKSSSLDFNKYKDFNAMNDAFNSSFSGMSFDIQKDTSKRKADPSKYEAEISKRKNEENLKKEKEEKALAEKKLKEQEEKALLEKQLKEQKKQELKEKERREKEEKALLERQLKEKAKEEREKKALAEKELREREKKEKEEKALLEKELKEKEKREKEERALLEKNLKEQEKQELKEKERREKEEKALAEKELREKEKKEKEEKALLEKQLKEKAKEEKEKKLLVEKEAREKAKKEQEEKALLEKEFKEKEKQELKEKERKEKEEKNLAKKQLKEEKKLERLEKKKSKVKKNNKVLNILILILILLVVILGIYKAAKINGLFEKEIYELKIDLNDGKMALSFELTKGDSFDIDSIISKEQLGDNFISWNELVSRNENGIYILKDEPFNFEKFKISKDIFIVAVHDGDNYLFESDIKEDESKSNDSTPEVEVSLSSLEENIIIPRNETTSEIKLDVAITNSKEVPIWTSEGEGLSVDQNGNVMIDLSNVSQVEGYITVSVENIKCSCHITAEKELILLTDKKVIETKYNSGSYETVTISSNIPVEWGYLNGTNVVSSNDYTIVVSINKTTKIVAKTKNGQMNSMEIIFN